MSVTDSELDALKWDIAERHRAVEDRKTLIDVLEHDGQDVSDFEAILRTERAELAAAMARQFALTARKS